MQEITRLYPDIRKDVSLADYSTFKIGGSARFFYAPEDERRLAEVLDYCRTFSLPVFVLGNGSNVLFADEGYHGLVIHTGKCKSVSALDGNILSSSCGTLLSALSSFALERGLGDLTFASGIPGSVGGAVYMNAGAYGGQMSDVICSVTSWSREHGIRTFKRDEMQFAYRDSTFMQNKEVVLSAAFQLYPENKEKLLSQTRQYALQRREKQPLQYPSAGSFFKRPKGAFAGQLIEQAGLKGYTVGGAQISTLHAGFIINTGGATARDVLSLMHAVQEAVLKQTGILLENEVEIVDAGE